MVAMSWGAGTSQRVPESSSSTPGPEVAASPAAVGMGCVSALQTPPSAHCSPEPGPVRSRPLFAAALSAPTAMQLQPHEATG